MPGGSASQNPAHPLCAWRGSLPPPAPPHPHRRDASDRKPVSLGIGDGGSRCARVVPMSAGPQGEGNGVSSITAQRDEGWGCAASLGLAPMLSVCLAVSEASCSFPGWGDPVTSCPCAKPSLVLIAGGRYSGMTQTASQHPRSYSPCPSLENSLFMALHPRSPWLLLGRDAHTLHRSLAGDQDLGPCCWGCLCPPCPASATDPFQAETLKSSPFFFLTPVTFSFI